MRRILLESLLVWVAVGLLAAAWSGWPALAEAAPGSGVGAWAARVAALGAGGEIAQPLDVPAALLARFAGLPCALALTTWAAFAAGAAVLWGVVRAGGAGAAGAVLAVALGAAPPVIGAALRDGRPELLAVPAVVAALAGFGSGGATGRIIGFAGVLLCAGFDPRLGAAAGIGAALAGGGAWSLLAALLAAGAGSADLATSAVLQPDDLYTPIASGIGLAAVLAALFVVRDRGLRLAALGAFILALGPTLQAHGAAVTVGGRAIPLPALLVALLDPEGGGWTSCLLVTAVAAALGVARAPRAALLLVPLAIFETGAFAGVPLPTTHLAPSVAVRFLSERTGAVLDLPFETRLPGVRSTARRGTNALYRYLQTIHGRPLGAGPAPLGDTAALYAEPGVVIALDASAGGEPFLIPPSRPGEPLSRLGVSEIVVHRDLFEADALALIDPVFSKLYGPPQRDHGGRIDLYRVRVAVSPDAPPFGEERLRHAGDPDAPGWRTLPDYLATLLPPVPAGAANNRGKPPQRTTQVDDAGSN